MIAPESTLLLSNFIIEYRTDDNISNSVTESMNQDGVWKQADEVGHAVEDWKSVKAFRIIMKEGIVLPHYTSADFIVPMRAPNYMYDEDSGGRYANNSFAISYDAQTYGQSNIVSAALLLNIPVKKVWNGGSNDMHKEIEIQLLSRISGSGDFKPLLDENGNEERITLNAEDANLKGEWTGLFLNKPVANIFGELYEYTVNEVTELDNFENTVTGEVRRGFVVTNTYIPPNTNITVSTEWLNGENAEKPGTSVTLMVKDSEGNFVQALDEEGNPITVVVDEEGNATFTEVPVTDKDGNPLTYTVVQEGLEESDWTNVSITEITPGTNEDGVVTVDPTQTNIHVVNEYVVTPILEPEPQPITEVEVTPPTVKPAPKTGDMGVMAPVVTLIAAMAMYVLVVGKKKEVNTK